MKDYFKNSSFIIFIVISILYLISNIIWYEINTPIIPEGISGVHFNDVFLNAWLFVNAPLITWIMKVMFFIFGKEYFDLQIIIVNYIFFLMGLYFMYKIGVKLKDKETGNLAMILFALTPGVYELSRTYGHQEYHTMCAVVLNIYCLIKTDCFKNRKWSILYGISVGLGLLIKDEFLICFFVPWVYLVISSLIKKVEINKILNILITIILGSLISYCHYFQMFTIKKIITEPIRETVNPFLFENFRITTVGLSEYLLTPPLFLLFLIGMVLFVIKYKKSINKIILVLYLIIPWAIVTFMPHHKEPEYNMLIVPVIILVVSLFLSNKKLISFITIVVLLFQFIAFSYNLIPGISIFNFKSLKKPISYFDRMFLHLTGKDNLNYRQYIEIYDVLKKYENINKVDFFLFWEQEPIIFYKTLENILRMKLGDKTIINFANNLEIEDFGNCDIFISIGNASLLDIVNYEYYCSKFYYMDDIKIKDKYISERIKLYEDKNKKINDKFYLQEQFYLQGIEDNNHMVRLYIRKDLANNKVD